MTLYYSQIDDGIFYKPGGNSVAEDNRGNVIGYTDASIDGNALNRESNVGLIAYDSGALDGNS